MNKSTPSSKSNKYTTQGSLLNSLPIDAIDRKIVEHLQKNGRRSYVSIASEIGLTEKTVRARARILFDKKIVQVVALTSPAALGYQVSTLAAISIKAPSFGTQVFDALARIDTIDYVALTYGRFAIFAEIIERDLKALQETIETKIGIIDGVNGIELFPYFSVHYQQAQIMNSDLSNADGVIDLKMSKTDQRIVTQLTLDGRAAYSVVAKRLGISESQVRTRVQHLINNRQVKIMAIVNPLKLLDSTMSWVAINVSSGIQINDVADALSSMQNISYVAICAGRFNIFVEVICNSKPELLDIIESQIRSVSGVEKTEAFIYINLHYKRLPPLNADD